jgi:DNA-binding MarR family transcriptional regulator
MARKKMLDNSPSAQAVQSWLAVVRAYHLCDATLARRLAAIGLRTGEHEVLLNLLLAPGLTQQQLAQRCFVAKSGVSMLVTRMEQGGWLQRRADALDARMRRLFLTPQGQAQAGRGRAIQDEVVSTMTQGAPPAELALVTAAMQRASAALEQMQQADAAAARQKKKGLVEARP